MPSTRCPIAWKATHLMMIPKKLIVTPPEALRFAAIATIIGKMHRRCQLQHCCAALGLEATIFSVKQFKKVIFQGNKIFPFGRQSIVRHALLRNLTRYNRLSRVDKSRAIGKVLCSYRRLHHPKLRRLRRLTPEQVQNFPQQQWRYFTDYMNEQMFHADVQTIEALTTIYPPTRKARNEPTTTTIKIIYARGVV